MRKNQFEREKNSAIIFIAECKAGVMKMVLLVYTCHWGNQVVKQERIKQFLI